MNRSKTDNFKKRISSIFYIVGPQRLATEKAGGVSDKQSTGKSSPPLSWNRKTNKQTNATAAEQAAETDKQKTRTKTDKKTTR